VSVPYSSFYACQAYLYPHSDTVQRTVMLAALCPMALVSNLAAMPLILRALMQRGCIGIAPISLGPLFAFAIL